MLSQASQCNQKHVNNGMGVFVIQQKHQLTKVWASDPSCSVKSTSTLTEHKGVVDTMMSSMCKLLVDLINYWVVSNWLGQIVVVVLSIAMDCQVIFCVDCTVCLLVMVVNIYRFFPVTFPSSSIWLFCFGTRPV